MWPGKIKQDLVVWEQYMVWEPDMVVWEQGMVTPNKENFAAGKFRKSMTSGGSRQENFAAGKFREAAKIREIFLHVKVIQTVAVNQINF